MDSLFATVAVTVLRPTASGTGPLNSPVPGEPERETVDGVLPQPGATSDLDASRPEGTSTTVTFHWPRGYGRSLRGCTILWGGRSWDVVGDPVPYVGANCPGPFDMSVEAVEADG